jgi:hypothetical protein
MRKKALSRAQQKKLGAPIKTRPSADGSRIDTTTLIVSLEEGPVVWIVKRPTSAGS